MTVGLEPDEIEAEVEKRLRDFAHSAVIPGFRPGKVPVKILRRRYVEEIRQDIFKDRVLRSFPKALEQEDLQPAVTPRIETDMDESARRYAYTAVFEVLPRFELGVLDGKTVKRPVATVTDTDLDEMLVRMREFKKTWSVVERPAQLGDRVEISFTGTVDGEPFENSSAEDVHIVLGREDMPPGFEEGLIGAQAGDERQVEVDFPDQFTPDEIKGKLASFSVRVSELAEPVVPELDADFAVEVGIPDGGLDKLRLNLRELMEQNLENRIKDRIKQQVMDLLLETNRIDLPETLVLKTIETFREDVRKRLDSPDFDLPDELLREQAERRVALGLIINEVIRVNHIESDPQQVREKVENLSSDYEGTQKIIDFIYSDEEHLARVEAMVREERVVDWVLEQIMIEDEPTTLDELLEYSDR